MESDPIRLRDDPSVEAALRDDLARAAQAPPPPFDAALGAAKLQAAIGSSVGPWIAGAIVAIAIGGAGIWLALRDGDPPPPEIAPPPVVEQAPAPEPRSEEPVAEREPAPPIEEPPPPPRVDPIRAEMELVARARAASRDNPRRALALAEEARRRFPRGILAEERDAIAILALAALDRDDEARRRGERFLARYPEGPFSDRVAHAIAREGSP